MVRKVELAAGIAAGILGVAALTLLLFAPLVPYCPQMSDTPCAHVRYTSLLRTGVDGPGWLYLLCMTGLLLAGALGAVAEARPRGIAAATFTRGSVAAIPLWASAIVTFAGCAFAARSAGLVYLPAVLALCLAAYASLLRRLPAWRVVPAGARAPAQAQAQAQAVDPELSSNRSG